MFANRFTAFIDACSLASVLRRNLLLSLAEAEFFRVRWSRTVLDETQRAIRKLIEARGESNPDERAAKQIAAMERAFEEAMVSDFDRFLCVCPDLPDPDDAHVVAAALKTQAATIVTENLKDFPPKIMEELGMEVRSADAFIANTIALDDGRAVAAVRRMRKRLKNPKKTPSVLLLEMEADGLTETAGLLAAHEMSL